MKKKISLYLQSLFYVFAGLNHFLNPEFYYPLIPDYLAELSGFINSFSGVVEIGFGTLLLFPKSRKRAAYGIIFMLIAFIPSHTYFIEVGSCIDDGLCVPEWVGWLRLIAIHPLLIWWAWSVRTFRLSSKGN